MQLLEGSFENSCGGLSANSQPDSKGYLPPRGALISKLYANNYLWKWFNNFGEDGEL